MIRQTILPGLDFKTNILDNNIIIPKLSRSQETANHYRAINNILDNLMLLNKDVITIIASYFEANPIKFFCLGNVPGSRNFINKFETDPYEFVGIFSGDHVNVFFAHCEEGYGPYYQGFVNIQKNIGHHMYDENKLGLDYIAGSKNNYSDQLWTNEPDNKIYTYGPLYVQYRDILGDGDGKLLKNDSIDDLHKCLGKFDDFYENSHSHWFTQIRKGRDIIKGTKFQHIFDANPDDHFFVSTTFRGTPEDCLIKLSEDEYASIFDELKEINNLFAMDAYHDYFVSIWPGLTLAFR
jgi:hypothetical protein